MKTAAIAVLILLLSPLAGHADIAGEIINEINIARTQPWKYVAYLKEWKDRYDGFRVKLPDGSYLSTYEDKRAVAEAIAYMERRKPVGPLVRSKGLDKAARRMVQLQGCTSQTGHHAPDGTTVSDRARLYGRWFNSIGENIAYGLDDPRLIIMMLIIDDGVPGRVHRNIMFRQEFKVAGAALGPHKSWGVMCVIDFAGGFEAF
jgi:uncharacterized protein YkwD